MINSLGGFLGTSSGPTVDAQTSNAYTGGMQGYLNGAQGAQNTQQGLMGQYNGSVAPGSITANSAQNAQDNGIYGQGSSALNNQLQTGQNLQAGQTNQLNNLQNQGFQLTPGDQTQYGQESGQIARQMGQQQNSAANDLAQRGLSSSGAAGATFSGLQGTQNEMLGQAQQQIAQQRYQNTMNQIGQQQQFIGQLNAQNNQGANNSASYGQNALNSAQSGNLSGYSSIMGAANNASTQANNLAQSSADAAGAQTKANTASNEGLLGAAQFNADNKPENFMDQSIANSNTASNSFAKGLGQAGSAAL